MPGVVVRHTSSKILYVCVRTAATTTSIQLAVGATYLALQVPLTASRSRQTRPCIVARAGHARRMHADARAFSSGVLRSMRCMFDIALCGHVSSSQGEAAGFRSGLLFRVLCRCLHATSVSKAVVVGRCVSDPGVHTGMQDFGLKEMLPSACSGFHFPGPGCDGSDSPQYCRDQHECVKQVWRLSF